MTLRLPWFTMAIGALILTMHCLAGPASPDFIYLRDLSLVEQGWRWMSAHFVHADINHLKWNLVAVGTLGFVLAKERVPNLGAMTAFCILGVNIGLVLDDHLARYCGFSGVLNGWLAVLLLNMWRKSSNRFLILLVGLGAVCKICIELATQSAIFTDHTWRTVPLAHAAGALSGIIWCALTSGASNLANFIKPKFMRICQ